MIHLTRRCLVHEFYYMRDYRNHLDEMMEQCEAFQRGWTWD